MLPRKACKASSGHLLRDLRHSGVHTYRHAVVPRGVLECTAIAAAFGRMERVQSVQLAFGVYYI